MKTKHRFDKFIKEALKLGARDARVIHPKSVATGAWVRMKCRYGCDGYARCLTCPPNSPTPEETATVLSGYRTALLLHGDDHTDITRIAVTLERSVFLDGYYKAFSFGSGPCRLCPECNLKTRECRHPYEARPAMEACGIDVFQTARRAGFPIEVVRDQGDTQNYYGLVLIE
ncbi:MAG: DUF2284 domain-containing protein [Lentisphaerae bacterium]|nr:DUF2284 domain-containing protein [Lentisphaerota bacterium]